MLAGKPIIVLFTAILVVSTSSSSFGAEMERSELPAAFLMDGNPLPIDTISNYEIVLQLTSRSRSDTLADSIPVKVFGRFQCFYYSESDPTLTGSPIPFLKLNDVRAIGDENSGTAIYCTIVDSGSFEEIYPNRYAGPVYEIEPFSPPTYTEGLVIEYSAVLEYPDGDKEISRGAYEQMLFPYGAPWTDSVFYWIHSKWYPNPF